MMFAMDSLVVTLPPLDIFPAVIEPLPAGVPWRARIRALTADGALYLAWSTSDGTDVQHVRLVPDGSTAVDLTHTGGQFGEHRITRGGGCGCGYTSLKRWQPQPS